MPCNTVRSTITEPGDTGHLESRKAKILAKKSSDSFARIVVLVQNAVLEALFTILAQKSAIFSARINKWHAASDDPSHIVGPFFSGANVTKGCMPLVMLITLSVFPIVFEVEVLTVAVVEMAGLRVF